MSENMQSEVSSHQDIDRAIPSISESVVIHTEPQEAEHLPLNNPPPPTSTRRPYLCVAVLLIVLLVTVGVVVWVRGRAAEGKLLHREGSVEFNSTLALKYTWIQQKLDHFDSNNDSLWWQRLFFKYYGNHFNSTSPIFLYVPPFQNSKSLQKSPSLLDVAERLEGLSLTLQPRYFGESLPFGGESLSKQNLRFLSIDQMIEDLAHLVRRTSELNVLGITKSNPWIVNGARIAGTIAVWFRSKYPDLTAAAFASSPFLPALFVPEVGMRSYNSVKTGGRKCRIAIQKLKEQFEEKMFGENQVEAIKKYSEGVVMTAEEVVYMVEARLILMSREIYFTLCSRMKDEEVLIIFQQLAFVQDSRNTDPIAYSQEELSNPKTYQFVEEARTHRAIWYLRCSQTALFEITSANQTLISPQINEKFFSDHCSGIFQAPIWPNPKQIGNRYAPYMEKATRIAITHGQFDPWLDYALMPGNNTQIELIMMNCAGCQTSSDYIKDSLGMKYVLEAQNKQKDLAKKWIFEALKEK